MKIFHVFCISGLLNLCAVTTFNNNPPPWECDGLKDMNDEILARCTCGSFQTEPPLYKCIRKCPDDEQLTYATGLEKWALCAKEHFPNLDVPSAEEQLFTHQPSSNKPEPTVTDDGALQRAIPTLLRAVFPSPQLSRLQI
jgi:hypothetical protein